jgi:acyl transferase domain-containing protein/thioesterase domain-containing protein
MTDGADDRLNDVAVIGMAARFPGAVDLDEYWSNLRQGIESITFFSDDELLASGIDPSLVNDARYVKAAPVFPYDPGLFDAGLFGLTPREAEIMDPQHRVLLECAWEALEHAAYDPKRFDGRIGVFAGSSLNTYLLFNLASNLTAADGFETVIRNDKDYLTTNISYKLNLTGPSIAVQTACSTALVSIHLACQSLLSRECDLALAGGIRIVVPQRTGYLHQQGGVFSRDGHCRPFDRQADGTIFGSGAGIVVLKRCRAALDDGDEIHAVIKGSAVNNDGALKVGFAAPGFEGQTQVIAEALGVAGVSPATIGYVETHGTGTPIGDPLEISALTRAYRSDESRPHRCAIGSVKSNIGHLEAAAGVASFIKTVLALKHRTLPPSLHVERPNPRIDFAAGQFYVNGAATPWPAIATQPRRAGVSSFGIGGTNAHAILEEAPSPRTHTSRRPRQLLVLSARTATALDAATSRLADHLTQHPDINIADAAYTLQIGRRALPHRRVIVCRGRDDAVRAIERVDPSRTADGSSPPRSRPVVWMFPGQGAQRVDMLAELYAGEPVFREGIDRSATLLLPHLGTDLRHLLYPEPSQRTAAAAQLTQTAFAQPALFAVEWALSQLWTSWGVHPAAMLGHSIGEYVAASLAGVFTLKDALALVAARGRLMQDLPAGAMLAVPLPEEELTALLDREVSVAAVNAPGLCTATGTIEGIRSLEQALSEKGVQCRMLHTSHAFHSPMMEPITARFLERVGAVALHPPRIRFVSNLTGTWIRDEEATDPAYWTRHLRHTVRFSEGLGAVLAQQDAVLLEVGPGQALSTFARHHPARGADHLVVPSAGNPSRDESDADQVTLALGKMWIAGADVDFEAVHAPERRRRIPMPCYPFERQRYWIEGRYDGLARSDRDRGRHDADAGGGDGSARKPEPSHDRPALYTPYTAPIGELEQRIAQVWQEVLGITGVGRHDNFFDLGGHSLLLIALRARLQDALNLDARPEWLAQAATVAELAATIAAARDGEATPLTSRQTVVPIQPRGTRRPLFCVHPDAGKLTGFVDLARRLGEDQPFYGLQAPAFDHERARLTVAGLAESSITALKGVQPHGPYALCGYSFGGIVAFEIARQLEARGDTVDVLALLDSMPLPRGISAEGVPDDRVLLAWFAWEMGRLYRRNVDVSFGRLMELDREAGLRYVLERAGLEALAVTARSFDEVRSLFELFADNIRTLWEHVPGRYGGASVHVVRAQETLASDLVQGLAPQLLRHVLDVHMIDPTYGWGAFLSTRPTVHVASGNHFSMLSDPHVGGLAATLARVLQPRQITPRTETPRHVGSRIEAEFPETSAPMSNPDLVGTWKLVSWQLRTASGEVLLRPFGDAVGYVIYSDDGYMSLSVMKANRTRSASDNPFVASTADNAAAAESYFSYCGRYDVRDGHVIHHIEAGLFPNWVGESQERGYSIDGNRLSLAAPATVGSMELVHHLEWERVG